MIDIAEALALAEAGFNVKISARGIEVLSNREVAEMIEAGDE